MLNVEERKSVQLDQVQAFVLSWLPGESLYSLMARNHFLRGLSSADAVISDFFGTRNGASLHNDLREIDVFAKRTEEALGTADQVLNEHTLYRFYKIFMTEGEKKLIEARRKPAKNMLNFPLALAVGSFRAYHPLKGCPDCVAEDQKKIGMSYWRLAHQYPGNWMCQRHDRPLLLATLPPPPQHGFTWVTPGMQSFHAPAVHLQEEHDLAKFKWLAEFIHALTVDTEAGIMRVAEQKEKFRAFAASAGILTPQGKLRSIHLSSALDLSKSLLEFVLQFKGSDDFVSLPSTLDESHHLLTRYLSSTRKLQAVERLMLTAWSATQFESFGEPWQNE